MRGPEIRSLAVRAGIAPGVSVLDLCCGVAGPGRFITSELGCTYLGVDSSASGNRDRAGARCATFRVASRSLGSHQCRPVRSTWCSCWRRCSPSADKEPLLREISSALPVGGRFAFTVEEGRPLTEAERAIMPDADTVWLLPLPQLLSCLERVGLHVRWVEECSRLHQEMVDALIDAFVADQDSITADLGGRAVDELLAAHRLWSDWLSEGRVRKFACVAEKIDIRAGQ